MNILRIVVICLTACLFSCGQKGKPDTQPQTSVPSIFTDITKQSGLNFIHEPGVDGTYFMPESLGSGCAFFDYDNDGLLDIYLINSGWHGKEQKARVTNHLFHQKPDHTFSDVTQASRLTGTGYGMGVAIGDYDNDGFQDVYVTNYGPDVLYHNNGNGTFTDITKASGINNPEWGTSAVFFDYDRDGYLDLYVANYVKFDPMVVCMDKAGRLDYCGPQGFAATPDKLYHNNRNGTFTDVSLQSGIGKVSGKGLGVLVFDFNRDSYPDIYVANDGEPNFLWINQKDGTFQDQAIPLGAAVNATGQAEAGMGVTAEDVDRDDDFDLFITHLRDEKNTFYRNYVANGFQDESWAVGLAGPSIPFTGFGTGFFDYDNDGDLDLAVVNGRVTRGPLMTKSAKPSHWDYYAEPNLLFQNDGTAHFALNANDAGSFSSTVENSRGLAFGDIDNDGDIDLLVSNEGGPARLYRNDLKNKNHWLIVRAIDPKINRDAIGAEITIVVNGKRFLRQVAPAYSYLSNNDVRVHFGLGTATSVQEINIRWPDGTVKKYPHVQTNQILKFSK
jgi:hypothetical protein